MKIQNISNKFILAAASLAIIGLSFSACKKKTTPPNPNEEELITTFRITFTDSAGVHPQVTATYRDVDGDGGNNPTTWDTIRLKPGSTYLAAIELLDESKTPADTITNEVRDEGDEHLFCFTVTAANCDIQRTDKDANMLELGLSSTWRTGAVSTGNAQIVLRHQPGTKTGSCLPGESDIDLTFRLEVQ